MDFVLDLILGVTLVYSCLRWVCLRCGFNVCLVLMFWVRLICFYSLLVRFLLQLICVGLY